MTGTNKQKRASMSRLVGMLLCLAMLFTLAACFTACEQGPQGEPGIQGEQGPQGEKGDKGDTGAQGEKGDTGAQGEKGDKGDPGAQGEQGLQGEKGDKGDTGAQGEKGDKGDPGAQGEQGLQGNKGDKGDTGAQGEKGDKGDAGVGIAKIELIAGELIITYTDGNVVNLGKLVQDEDDEDPSEDPDETITDLPAVTNEAASDYAGGTYSYQELYLYTDDEAAAAGVPAGYEDHVMKLIGSDLGESGVVIDFTKWNIQVDDIASMTIRYYVDDQCGAIRLANDKTFIVLESNIAKSQWAELTVKDCFYSFANNEDGTLGKVALCFRHGKTFYVDHITFEMKDPDAESLTDIPEITSKPTADYIGGNYNYQTLGVYTTEEAQTENVPEGYSGHVMKMVGNGLGANGVVVDFTKWNIKVEDIASMTIRYYVDNDCGSIRLASGQNFLINEANIAKNQWAELTVSGIFDSFTNNADGTLGSVALCFRHGNTFYVDSITFTMIGQP